MDNEPRTVGLSHETKTKLDRLKSDGHFLEMMDAYKFAIGLALASSAIHPPLKNTTTFVNVGSLDSDRALYDIVKLLRDEADEPVYKTAERLAEWGINELYAQTENGTIDFSAILLAVNRV